MVKNNTKVKIIIKNEVTGKEEVWEMGLHENGVPYIMMAEKDRSPDDWVREWYGPMLSGQIDPNVDFFRGFIAGRNVEVLKKVKTIKGIPFPKSPNSNKKPKKK